MLLLIAGSSGSVVYPDLSPGRYTLRIAAINFKKEDRAILRRRFEVPPAANVCLLHLVDEGLAVDARSGNVTVDFGAVGPVEGFLCFLDGAEAVTCECSFLSDCTGLNSTPCSPLLSLLASCCDFIFKARNARWVNSSVAAVHATSKFKIPIIKTL